MDYVIIFFVCDHKILKYGENFESCLLMVNQTILSFEYLAAKEQSRLCDEL